MPKITSAGASNAWEPQGPAEGGVISTNDDVLMAGEQGTGGGMPPVSNDEPVTEDAAPPAEPAPAAPQAPPAAKAAPASPKRSAPPAAPQEA